MSKQPNACVSSDRLEGYLYVCLCVGYVHGASTSIVQCKPAAAAAAAKL